MLSIMEDDLIKNKKDASANFTDKFKLLSEVLRSS